MISVTGTSEVGVKHKYINMYKGQMPNGILNILGQLDRLVYDW